MTFRLLVLAGLLVLSACGTHRSVVWDGTTDPPRLKDGTITLKTTWTTREEESDVRRLRCRGGKVTAELISRSQGHRVGEVPVGRWEAIWEKMLETRPFSPKPRFDLGVNDPRAAGPFHVVSLQLGTRFHQFSAQFRMNVLGVFKTSDVAERLRYSDAVAELVSAYATQELAAPGSPAPDGESGK